MFAVFVHTSAQPASVSMVLMVALILLSVLATLSWAWKRPLLQRTSIASGTAALLFFFMLWADYPFCWYPF